MWGHQYDENLRDNPFFREIESNHSDLVAKASQEDWVICVPRVGVVDPSTITVDIILDHILVCCDDFWFTLSKRRVSIANKEVTTPDEHQSTKILFEETFYKNNLKYTVLCVDRPLFCDRTFCDRRVVVLQTLDDCIDFLWAEGLSHVLIKIQRCCDSFVEVNRGLAAENLQGQKDLIGSLYSQCLQLALKNRDSSECENVKIAVEAYMQSCLDQNLIRAINTVTCFSDAALNKVVRNSSDLQLKDLNVPSKFCDIITHAKGELNKINNYVTILDKINCLKLTFNQLCAGSCLTSDDILQILVFLVLKLNISNWFSNLVYLTHFRFSSLVTSNEANYVVTSLEAALEFLKSEEFLKIKPSFQTTNPLFQAVFTNDLAQLKQLLEEKHKGTKVKPNTCHPLCYCDQCFHCNSSHSTVNEKGQSLLSVATILGRPEIVELLLGMGAEVDSPDYSGRTPLHHSCVKGHQDILLILMNCKAGPNAKDNDGNTPLHLATLNGHESCVKALFYTANSLDVDCVNKYGETPLHLGVRWGYMGVVRTLLEHGAVASIPNKKNLTAMELAQNYYSEKLLKQFHQHLEVDTKFVQRNDHVQQLKKIDLLLKAIENNDLPLTCFYLGFPNNTNLDFRSKCHPLCNCSKCEEFDGSPHVTSEPITVNACNIDGFTPLHFAAKYGRIPLLRILLDSSALPNCKTYKTLQTPLHLACIHQRLQAVKELVECKNCDIDARDYKGNTALYYACMKNNPKIVEVLLENSASCELRNYEGNCVVKEVREKSLFSIASLLEDPGDVDRDFL